jgi:hypothetical protein
MAPGDLGQRRSHSETDLQRAGRHAPEQAGKVECVARKIDTESGPQLVQRTLLRGRNSPFTSNEAADLAEVFGLTQKNNPSTGDEALA